MICLAEREKEVINGNLNCKKSVTNKFGEIMVCFGGVFFLLLRLVYVHRGFEIIWWISFALFSANAFLSRSVVVVFQSALQVAKCLA